MKVTKKFAAIALAFVLLTGVCVVPASAGAAPAPFYLGDKNGDGIVGISDFVLLLRALFGIAPLQSDSALRADVDADGTTGFKDAFLILLTALKMIPPAEYNAGGGETEEFVMGSHDLVVSPLGSDLWSGKIPEPNAEGTDGPLASIEEAKERLKKLKNIDCGEGSDCILKDVTVWLREGAYFPAATLKFGPDDLGNVTYKAYPGEKPAISGAVPVSGWRAETVNGVPAWTTQLEPGTAFNTLYRGGTSLPRPRFPKEGELNVASVNHADELAPDSTYFKANLSFNANPADMFAFHNLKDVDVRILHFWKDELIPLESFDPATGYVRLSKPSSMTISEGDRYFFENVFEALDEPGEWYLDQVTGKLAYVPEPSEDIASTVLYAGKLERIMSIDSVDGIVFEGITFRDSEWNIVPQPLENSQAAYGVAPCILVQ
ncbi:MAG TPA: dockerin type I repeat-containing protein, partial [Clostridiales bacterium]|nr:dockerin type I repeat-containing protein [Clostridiales bacterium]